MSQGPRDNTGVKVPALYVVDPGSILSTACGSLSIALGVTSEHSGYVRQPLPNKMSLLASEEMCFLSWRVLVFLYICSYIEQSSATL